MAQQHFGTRLAEARRRRGLTIEQVHRQLRITPAILEALESGDFRHIPFKGHARNMVSSYARYLGLNPEELTKQFLKEYHDFENHELHARSLPRSGTYSRRETDDSSAYDSSAYDSRSLHSQSRNSIQSRASTQSRGAYQAGSSVNSRGTRSIWDRPIPISELNQGATSRTATSRTATSRTATSRTATSRTATSRRSTAVSTSTTTPRRAPAGAGPSVNRYGPGSYSPRPSLPMRVFGTLFKSPAVLIIFLIILLAGLLVLWALLANSCNKKEQTVTPPLSTSVVPSDGGNSNSGTTDGNATNGGNTPSQTENNNTAQPQLESFVLTIEPVSGEKPWVEVTVDGESVFNNFLSKKETWTVTSECSVLSGQPNNTIVMRDLARVDWVTNSYGIGTITLTARAKAGT